MLTLLPTILPSDNSQVRRSVIGNRVAEVDALREGPTNELYYRDLLKINKTKITLNKI